MPYQAHFAALGPDGDGTDLDGYAPPRTVITPIVANRAFGAPSELFQALAEDNADCYHDGEDCVCFTEESDEIGAADAEHAWREMMYERDVETPQACEGEISTGASDQDIAKYCSADDAIFIGVRRALAGCGGWVYRGVSSDRSWKCFRNAQRRP